MSTDDTALEEMARTHVAEIARARAEARAAALAEAVRAVEALAMNADRADALDAIRALPASPSAAPVEPAPLPMCACGRDRVMGTATMKCPACYPSWLAEIADEMEASAAPVEPAPLPPPSSEAVALAAWEARQAFGAAVIAWQDAHRDCAGSLLYEHGRLVCHGCGATREQPPPPPSSPTPAAPMNAELNVEPGRERFRCPNCGEGVAADEDGCCVMCGRDCAIEPATARTDGGTP